MEAGPTVPSSSSSERDQAGLIHRVFDDWSPLPAIVGREVPRADGAI